MMALLQKRNSGQPTIDAGGTDTVASSMSVRIIPRHDVSKYFEGPAISDDTTLMARIASGDKVAFAEFLSRHLVAVVNFAGRYVQQTADAEDIAQEVFVRVWRKAPQWRDLGLAPRSWVYRITYNICIDEFRQRRPEPSLASEYLVDTAATPEELTLDRDRISHLESALNLLPERQRAAIYLCAYQGLTNREAAASMEISVEALESLLSRGRRRLRQQLQIDPIRSL